jgi:hypothetical protein
MSGLNIASVNERPRLLVQSGEFERLSGLIETDERAKRWFDWVYARGESALQESPSQYELPDGKRLLSKSRQALQRSLDLATIYRLTDEERFAKRLGRELEAVADFPDWNPSHFLDVAEMTAAVAIGYDWCYEYWSEKERQRFANAIIDHGLEAGMPAYRAMGDPATEPPTEHAWAERPNNWNTVCNAGLTIGALALLEEGYESGLLQTVVQRAHESLELALDAIGPNGGWEEGPVYWSYNANYLVMYYSSIRQSLGCDAVTETPLLRHLGDFPLYLTGPTRKLFSFGDTHEDDIVDTAAMQWLARRYNTPAYARYQWQSLDEAAVSGHSRFLAANLLWYEPEFNVSEGPDLSSLPLDREFPGGDHALTFRSAWNDERATFLGFKGGDKPSGHGDLDVGTFVFDDRGVRWASDLGDYDYTKVEPEFWDDSPEGSRWQFYRKRAEGHNTLVLDPDRGPDQDWTATCPLQRVRSTQDAGTAILDMSQAYPRARQIRRGVRLADGRSRLTVQDEIDIGEDDEGSTNADVWWFVHTKADVEITGRSATLRRNGERLRAVIASPDEATFEVGEATPLPNSPQPDIDGPIDGVSRLTIHLPDVTDTTLTVRLGQTVDLGAPTRSLSKWV